MDKHAVKVNNSIIIELKLIIKDILAKSINEDRKAKLNQLLKGLIDNYKYNDTIKLNFICTHNSRRSHLAQIWAQLASHYYDINNVVCYSGGTETTALNSNIVNSLLDLGFEIEQLSIGDNPIYAIKYDYNEMPIIGFSKTYDHPFNPHSDFIAIMVCDDASEKCPYVHGSRLIVPLTYLDPKRYDESPTKAKEYQGTSIKIASEMFYVFKELKQKISIN